MLANKLLSAMAGGVASDPLYVDDVFSAYTYTGNGSAQTINNGIDLAGKGGMVWIKERNNVYVHALVDTVRGTNQVLSSHTTAAQTTYGSTVTTFNANGFSIGGAAIVNEATADYEKFVSWTFRKAPKFFDVVTYTGNSSSVTRHIPHSLGVSPGLIIIKAVTGVSDWAVMARDNSGNYWSLLLNSTAAGSGGFAIAPSTIATSTTVDVSLGSNSTAQIFNNGVEYIVYLFAHDPDTVNGIVQCGSFTTDGSGNVPAVTLGWEPQYILYKRTDSTSQWSILDASRGFLASDYSPGLFANLSNAEGAQVGFVTPTSTGFQVTNNRGPVSSTYIYLAIRRPNKPPTVGTQVYNAIVRTGTDSAATIAGVGFAPDLLLSTWRSTICMTKAVDRLRSPQKYLETHLQNGELTKTDSVLSFTMDGVTVGADSGGILNFSTITYVHNFFKRSQGVFDIVCYTGTNVARAQEHSLGAVPEMLIFKARNISSHWFVYHAAMGYNYAVLLQDSSGKNVDARLTNVPGSTVVHLNGQFYDVNNASTDYVMYLFATKVGVSKCGGYVGNGSSQTINCGFTTGARFVLIKRTDVNGNWFVWDTARGISEGNDPYFALNSINAEVTSNDSIDPVTTGFIVNQVAATDINVNEATYIFLAFA